MRDGARGTRFMRCRSTDGTVEPGWPVDAATAFGGSFDPMVQNQRGALALFGGRVFVPFGGSRGRLRRYITGWSSAFRLQTRQGHGLLDPRAGGRRSGRRAGSPATESRCSPRPATPCSSRNGATAKRCCASLPTSPARSRTRDYFAPSNWQELDNHDLDLGGTAPIPLDVPSAKGVRKLILAIGKDGDAYLLDRDNFGGIGGELASAHVTPTLHDRVLAGRLERRRRRLCRASRRMARIVRPTSRGKGLLVLKIRADPAPAIETAWCGNVASVQRRADRHHHRRPLESDRVRPRRAGRQPALRLTGATPASFSLSPRDRVLGTTKFQTLIAADGRLYVTGGGKVYAFTF